MATPLVAGWAAIIKGQNPSFTNEEINTSVITTSEPDVIISPPQDQTSANRLLQIELCKLYQNLYNQCNEMIQIFQRQTQCPTVNLISII
ncbi:hypothetical protein B4U80_14561 [Leptotrombidium deliense]|uniref:Peptidase S8/S53 domain-containing protein n=1 Tax=Leptotrombidium deliense TaxID=299467 RepID=A0A443RU76_9ACAR|nr:hypothetical protein B4U80_14561 [Leptotrombidium deliense]